MGRAWVLCVPARNIVELIARHTRPYEYDDPFTVAAIEGVSEVGMLDAGVRVRVTRVDGSTVKVRPV